MALSVVAIREARESSRRARSYHARWIIAGVALGAMLYGLWRSQAAGMDAQGNSAFVWLAVVAHFYALLAGVIATADAIAFERRENTLGLLFLTDLKARDVLGGKLLASATASFFGLLAILPLLAVPMLLGGVSLDRVLFLAAGLLATLLLSLSFGILFSTIFRQGWAALAAGLFIMVGAGILLPAAGAAVHISPGSIVAKFIFLCPSVTAIAVWQPPLREVDLILQSLAATTAVALGNFAITASRMRWLWRDAPLGPAQERRRQATARFRFGAPRARQKLREKLLDQNPLAWLANREQISSLGLNAICLLTFGGALALWLATGNWQIHRLLRLVFFALVFIHAVLLFRICSAAAYPLAENRKSGALELLLSTPMTAQELVLGRWRGILRQFFGPVVILMTCQVPFLTALLWGSRFGDQSLMAGLSSFDLESGAAEILQICFASVVFAANWIAAGWLGMWLGLRMKSSSAAVWATYLLTLAPPILVIAGARFFMEVTGVSSHFGGDFERAVVTVILFIAGLANARFLMRFARLKLLSGFRPTAAGAYETVRHPFSWRPVIRLAQTATVVLGLTIATFWVRREHLNRRGIASIDAVLSAHPGFNVDQWAPQIPSPQKEVYRLEDRPDLPIAALNWLSDRPQNVWQKADLYRLQDVERYLVARRLIRRKAGSPARSVQEALAPIEPFLNDLRTAADADPARIFEADSSLLRSIANVVALRAIVLIRIGEAPAEDIFLIARLAEGAPEKSDVLVAAIQPLFEGFAHRRWKEADLRAFQSWIAKLDLWSEQRARVLEYIWMTLQSATYHRRVVDSRLERLRFLTPPSGPALERQASIFKLGLELFPAYFDATARRVNLAAGVRLRNEAPAANGAHSDIHRKVHGNVRDFARIRVALDQVQIACALELYRLKFDSYPPRIDDLIPGFASNLPPDLLTGESMRYEPVESGRDYRLYSVGWDGHDDGGTVPLAPPDWTGDHEPAGDWVWRSPAR